MSRVQEETDYWQTAALDDDVDQKYIADIDTEECLVALAPLGRVAELSSIKILDLGCGVGRLSIPIARRFIDHEVYGVDLSDRMLKIAAKRAEGLKNLQLVDNDGRTIPFPDDYFMAAYTMLLFQHLPREAVAGYIKEVARVLKKGGVFRFQFIDGKENEPFSKHHTLLEIKRACQDAGLHIEQINNAVHPLWTWITASK